MYIFCYFEHTYCRQHKSLSWHTYLWEPFKYYFEDFSRKGRGGTPQIYNLISARGGGLRVDLPNIWFQEAKPLLPTSPTKPLNQGTIAHDNNKVTKYF